MLPPGKERRNFCAPAARVHAMPLKVVGAQEQRGIPLFGDSIDARDLQGQAQALKYGAPVAKKQTSG